MDNFTWIQQFLYHHTHKLSMSSAMMKISGMGIVNGRRMVWGTS